LPGSDRPCLDRAHLRQHLAAIVRAAGALALATFQGVSLKSWTKGHSSPVSEADIAVNDFLRERLVALAPTAGWLSEETEDDLARTQAASLWIVDPIDGTRAYIAGRPDWSIAVALAEQGRPALAAIYAPVSDELFLAAAGEGATLNGAQVNASGGGGLTGARIAGPQGVLKRLAALRPQLVAEPKVHSLALRLARVAQGRFDAAFASHSSHDWDLAAADLLVHEAGGALTDFTGRALTYNLPHPVHGALLAAGQARHATLIELVRDRHSEFV
jgi:myo-inositol-1(or 4)-monophosphatase